MRVLTLLQRSLHWRRLSSKFVEQSLSHIDFSADLYLPGLKPTVVRNDRNKTTKPKLITSTGLLITLSQFIFTALAASFSQITPTLTLKSPSVPMRKWAYIALIFFAVNMLNNWAFAFNISVPVHIILRSFGSVTTMLAGALQGKRYSWLQVSSVVILTLGVLVSAFADADSKVCCRPAHLNM